MFFVYILFSQTLDHYYIGYTSSSVEERLQKHLAMHKGFTNRAKDWKIVHTENYHAKAEAMHREAQLKSWKNKERIITLISSSE